MFWKVPKLWPDSTVFIIGGGSSIKHQIEHIATVLWEIREDHLNQARTIACNDAYMWGDMIDVCLFGDWSWFTYQCENHAAALRQFTGMFVSPCDEAKRCPAVKAVQRRKRGLCEDPDFIAWNCNSGGCAINLALHLGAKKIVLVGFDMKLNEKTRESNWHPNEKAIKHGKPPTQDSYTRMLGFFTSIKEDLDKKFPNVEVINATPGSALKEFPIMSFDEVVQWHSSQPQK